MELNIDEKIDRILGGKDIGSRIQELGYYLTGKPQRLLRDALE